MSQWVIKGMRTGIKSTAYPRSGEFATGVTPGLPQAVAAGEHTAALLACCPTGALEHIEGKVVVDYRRCIHCYRCVRELPQALDWQMSYEWAGTHTATSPVKVLEQPFKHSVNILVVDAGDCGACLNEVRQLNNPYYNMHRLGFFITPSPRHADLLLVVGTVTDHMRVPLKKIYDAMPAPKRVVAAGSCALSGGVFAESFVCSGGVAGLLPVDVEVPGNPPPPLAILHGLLVAVGRKPPASLADTQPGHQPDAEGH